MPMRLFRFFSPKSAFRSLSSDRKSAGKAALFYLMAAGAWVWLTNRGIDQLVMDAQRKVWGQAAQEWALIILTSAVLFMLLRQRQTRSDQESNWSSIDPLDFNKLAQMVPVGRAVVREQIIMSANAHLCGLTGYAQEELIGMDSHLLYADASEADLQKDLQPSRGQSTGTVATSWVRKDGVIVPVHLHVALLNPDNPAAGSLFTVTDMNVSRLMEQVLEQQKELYLFFVQSAEDGILLCDRTGTVLQANQTMCNFLRLTQGELVGKQITAFFRIMADEKVRPFCHDFVQQGQTVEVEWLLTTTGDVERSLDARVVAMSDGTYLVIFHDVTERKAVEKALRESEKKFTLAFATSPDAIIINRLVDGVLVETNKSFTALTGYSRAEVVGLSPVQLNLWRDPAERDRLIKQLYAQGYCENMEAGFRRKDGSYGIGSVSSRLLELNDVLHVVSIVRDITRRKQTEIDLERLKVAIEQAGEVVVITEVDGSIVYANPAFSEVTGYAREEVLGKNPRILKSGEHDRTFYRELWRVISSGNTWSGRIVNRKKDGSLYTEEATISPIFDQQGSIVNYVAIKRDITAQLQLEAQYLHAQKMESIGRLTSGVAHDFNNILTVIVGYCEMAMTRADAGLPMAGELEEIHKAALRSADIVHQLRTFSRNQPIAPKPIDLNETVTGMLTMLQRSIGDDIELIWVPEKDLPIIKMDPSQLDQILVNLCVNARDAVHGSGTITLRTRSVDLDASFCAEREGIVPGRYVVVQVIDTGCGIAEELRNQIFEPFFTTKGSLGTGLGLSTVYGIVKQNNGYVDVHGEPGKGTTFLVYLPVYDNGPVTVEVKERNVPSLGFGETILLVEDDSSVLALGQFMLESLGYRVLTATTPGEAMQLAEHNGTGFDLLVTDLVLPVMSGKELADRLVGRYPGLKVVFMSACPVEAAGHDLGLGDDVCFLQKPFSLTTMADSVKSALTAD